MKKELVYEGPIFNLAKVEVAPGVTYDMVDHPGAVVILPVKENGDFVLIKQYRPLIEETLISCPAGLIDNGENALDAAIRELKEETGYTAQAIMPMTYYYSSCGMTNEKITVFLATELAPGEQELDDDEKIEVVEIPREEALRMIRDFEIRQSHDIVAILFAEKFM